MQFALVRSSSKLTDIDCAFIAAAVNLQLRQVAADHDLPVIPCVFYSGVEGLPIDDVIVIHLVDNVGDPGALGWHSVIASYPVAEVLVQDFNGTAITASHEAVETAKDPTADGWTKRSDGTAVADEIADPVEGDSYPLPITIEKETRYVPLSNFVLPSWFKEDGQGPFDVMGKLTKPFSMDDGGYMVVADTTGNETEVFARRRISVGSLRGAGNVAKKLAKPTGRLKRRLQEPVVPLNA